MSSNPDGEEKKCIQNFIWKTLQQVFIFAVMFRLVPRPTRVL
jgi:hypothetical protein